MTKPHMRLDLFDNRDFDRGASRLKETMWIIVQSVIFSSWIPGSKWRCGMLRLFGASVGQGVVIKPYVSVKFPWRLELGDFVWLGERTWIDNLANVTIGSHSCVSQGAYLCTGSHDWSDCRFGLITRPIHIGEGCWVAARASLSPGTRLEDGAIVAMNVLGGGTVNAGEVLFSDGSTRKRLKQNTGAN